VTTLRERERKSHAIHKGDVFVTQAGSILYLVSSDRHHKLVLAKFLRSTSLTGQVSVSTIISFFPFSGMIYIIISIFIHCRCII
jgi:hypothetical protein